MTVRQPAVAGLFYPRERRDLAAAVDGLLHAAAHEASATLYPPKALVAPHAGYIYSGPVAATAYATLASRADAITRVVLLGPAHRVPLAGIALPTVDAFRTPLGDVPIDGAAREILLSLPGVVLDDAAHAEEHSIEVHLPFLQRTLRTFSIVPMVVGRCDPHTVAAALDAVWGGDETLVIISSDLSHYEDHASAARHDRATAAAVLDGSADAIGPYDACGAYPLRGLLEAAREHALTPALLDLRSSGDTAGSRDRVVGYGAFAFATSGSSS